jgi:hypothetical protein
VPLTPLMPQTPPMPGAPPAASPPGVSITDRPTGTQAGQAPGPDQGQRSSKKHRGRSSDPEKTMRRAQARHPYAVTQSLENKFRDAQAALMAAAVGPATEEVIKQLVSISARLRPPGLLPSRVGALAG